MSSNKKQATGGSANSGPGLKNGLQPRSDRVSLPGPGFKVVPNSAHRGKRG